MEFYEKIKALPDDVIGIILNYLPHNKKLTLMQLYITKLQKIFLIENL